MLANFRPEWGIPWHDDRLETRAAEVAFLHVLGVKLDLPEALEAHHLLHPRKRGLEREKVARDVIHVGDAKAIGAAARGFEAREIGHNRRFALVLHEAKQRVAERRGDVEPHHEPPFDPAPLDAGDRGRAALDQKRKRLLDVRDVEHHATDPFGMLFEPVIASSPLEPSGSMKTKRTPPASTTLARARCSASNSGVDTATSAKSRLFT